MSLRHIYVILFFSLCLFTKAQKIKFDNYTSKDGLISDDVYKIFQDQKGYLWLFTDYGVMKYNGKKFEQTLKNLPFNESFVYSYFQNKKGQIWIANSNAKIYEVRNDSAFIVKGIEAISEKLKKNIAEITQLFVDDSLNIFAVTKSATFKFSKHKHYEGIDLSLQYKQDSIEYNLICKDEDLLPVLSKKLKGKTGGYFLAHKKINIEFNQHDNEKEIFEIPSSVLTGPRLFKKFGKDIYIVSYNKVIKIGADKSIKEIQLKSIINGLIKDKNNHLWVGCYNNGLFEIDSKDSIINHYFKDKTVNEIFIDSQNGLWVSTTGFGLYHCKGFSTYYFEETEPLGYPVNLIKKIDDKLFVFNNQGDMFIVGENEIESIKNNNDIKSEPLDVIQYHSLFLISYRHKTEYFDLKKGVVKTIIPQQRQFYVPYKYSLINNDTLLLVRRNGFMIACNDSLLKKVEFKFKVNDCIAETGKIIIASDQGLYEYINDQLIRPDYFKTTETSNVSKIVKGKFGDLWFCTKGFGLYKLSSNNVLLHYTVESGLPSNIVNDISFSTDHSILLSTNTGLFRSSKYKKWIQIYGEQVQSAIEFRNDIFFSTKKGLIISKNIKSNDRYPVYFNLASVLINTNLVDFKKLHNLKYNQNNLEFNFDVISFSSSISDIIYKLSGTKNQIGITKNQQVIFQGLSPGSYTLTASLVASDSKSNSIVIPFVIVPIFWQTIWFQLLSAIIGLICCCLIGWELFRYFKMKEDKRNKAYMLITEYKLIALKAQINPHFMSNCLTAIQHLILNNKVDEANQYLAKFSFLVRQVLNFSSKSIVSLKEELETISLNIELEQLRFENKFDYDVEIQNTIDIERTYVPPLILQPIIENAIWHGLLPLKKTRKGILKIMVFADTEILKIIIEDNGVGRKKSDRTIGNSKNSKGMQIIEQRIKNLNNLYKTTVGDLFFEDLVDDLNNPLGSRITIVLPIFNAKSYEENKDISY